MNNRNHSRVNVYRVTLNSKYNSFCIGPDLINEKELKFVYKDTNGENIEKIVPTEYFISKLSKTIYPNKQNGGYFYTLPAAIIKKYEHETSELKYNMKQNFLYPFPPGTPGPWLCVDKDGTELIFASKPIRDPNRNSYWTMRTTNVDKQDNIELPAGTIKKLIGKALTWKDEPFKLNEYAN